MNVTRFVLAGSTDEIPFAPGEGFVHGDEVGAGGFLDEFGLAEPLFVSAAFELNHGGEGVHAVGKAAGKRILGNGVHESQKRSHPGFDNSNAAVVSTDALYS